MKANLASEVIIAGLKGIASAIGSLAKGFAGALKDGVAYNAQTLMAFGISAEEAQLRLRQLGDIS